MLINHLVKFRVLITVWNKEGQYMDLLDVTMNGHTWPKETHWEGPIKFEAYSEGIDATLDIFKNVGDQLTNIRPIVAKKG